MKKPTTSYLALTATLLIAANPIGQAQAAPEPSAYWTMDAINDGLLLDETGVHNAKVPALTDQPDIKTGEILPDFTPETGDGIKGGALLLESKQQGYLSVAAPGEFNFTGGLTVSAWLKVKNGNALMNILSCAEDVPNPKGGWTLSYSYGNVSFKAVESTGNPVMVSSPKDSVAPNAWFHVVAVADGSTLRLYLNGEEVASKPFAGPIQMADTAMVIGNHATIAGWRHFECPAFGGLMDEVKIFEAPLTAAEIKAEADQALSGN
jgi:hypothetical protein